MDLKDVFVPGLIAGIFAEAFPVSAAATAIAPSWAAAIVMAALPKKRRRG
jgi:hypothetical protein